ncbi:MAG: hypothetical protein ACQGVC_06565 [Myxococcota bacterium]
MNAEAHAVLPRAFARVVGFGSSVAWLGAAAAAAYLAATAAILAVVGAPPGAEMGPFAVSHLTYALWFASVPIALAVLVRGAERDALELAPALGVGEAERAAFAGEALDVGRRAVWLGAAFGLLLAIPLCFFWLGPAADLHMGRIYVVTRELAVEVAIFAVLGWAAGAGVRLSNITRERARPDLLDPGAFAPLARNGVRFAAVYFVIVALGVPSLAVAPAAIADAAAPVWLAVLALAALSVVALIVPCRGARDALRAAKRRELDLVRRQIAEARREREDTRLPGLLAWEARVAGHPEWPIGASALVRSLLFMLLPVASWVASALVERLIDVSLG